MTENVADAHRLNPLKVTNPELIPAGRYFDPSFFELEKQKLWMRTWQMACRLEEIPEVGDYTEYRIFEKTVLIVRTKTGVKAFHNVCRHRGMRLLEGHGNCKGKGIICPFHGWRYNMDGENTFVFGRPVFSDALLDKADISLKPCRLETWAGCAFINFDDDAPSLLDSLGPHTRTLDARNADKLRTEWWYASEVPVNWKLVVEAFVENYHLMRTHPELHALTPNVMGSAMSDAISRARKSTGRETINQAVDWIANLSEGMGGLVHQSEVAVVERLRDMDAPEDAAEAITAFFARARDEVMQDGLNRGLPMFDVRKVAEEFPASSNELFFPNFFLLPFFSAMASYRIRPLTPETCYFEIWSLILVPEGEVHESPKAPTVLPHDSPDYPLIPRQDYSNMPNQQIGLRSGAISHQRLSASEEGAISNFERLIDGFIEDVDPAALVKGQHVVNGGSFKPIRDLGF